MSGPIIEIGYIAELSRCWEAVTSLGTIYRFRPGSEISFLHDSHVLWKFSYIRRGTIRSCLILPDGTKRLKMMIGEGSLIFETHCASGTCEHEMIHYCKQEAELCCFDASLLHDALFQQKWPHLVANVMKSIAIKYSLFDALLDNVYRRSAIQKVAWYLVRLYELKGEKKDFDSHLTQDEVASLLTLSRASMSRSVNALKADGIIGNFRRSTITVLNVEKLYDLVPGYTKPFGARAEYIRA